MTPADHSPDTAARPRWRALAGPLLAAGYAVWCLALLWLQPRSLLAIASFLLPCYLFICSWLWRRGWRPVAVGVALGLPALMRAAKLQKRAARVGFDWEDPADVAAKVAEEAAELAAAADPDAVEDELGDLLFSAVNLARHLGVDPERALRRANDKFQRRFNALEDDLRAAGSSPAEASAAEMEALWQAVKRAGRG